MDALLAWDQAAFVWLHRGLENSFFSWLLPWWRHPWFWTPFYLGLGYFLFKQRGSAALYSLLFVGLVVATSDVLSSFVVKQWVQRIRPCNDPLMFADVFLRAPCGSGYSFTSSHAANHMALAVFLGQTYFRTRSGRWWLVAWAMSIGFAQIYVGVHYPLDVLGGALLGLFVGVLWSKVFQSTRFFDR